MYELESELESWTFLDTIYFIVVTLATVGYGDLSPHDQIGRAACSVVIVAGIVIVPRQVILLTININNQFTTDVK